MNRDASMDALVSIRNQDLAPPIANENVANLSLLLNIFKRKRLAFCPSATDVNVQVRVEVVELVKLDQN